MNAIQNPIQLLRDDHKTILGLITQHEALAQRGSEMASSVARELLMELEIHGEVKRQILFPAFRRAALKQQDVRALALLVDAEDFEKDLETLIHQTRAQSQNGKLAVESIGTRVKSHMEEEEKDFLPLAQKYLSSSAGLVDQMLELKQSLTQQDRYDHSRAEVVQNPNGGEQKRKQSA